MLDIAERDDCTYDFWADPTGDIIGAWPSSQNPVGTRNSLGWVKLDRREALRQYGGFSLFRAVDNSAGYKREHNYHRDWYREREALHLHLSLMKTSFVTSEPIVAQITLTNTGSVPIRINRSRVLLDPSTPSGAGSDLGFHLIAPSGDQVPLLRKLDSSATIVEEYIELAPNQTITETYNLASSYNIQEPGQYQFWVSNRIASDSNRVVFDVSSR